jgi:16S rRNA (cytidine1402-2'-O)-methyltransferase
MSKSKGTLYLLPTTLGGDSIEDVLPLLVIELTRGLRHFVVEDLRSARRYLSRLGMPVRIEELEFDELNEHTNDIELDGLISPLIEGKSVGILSEAGVPAVADPGARLVSLAHIHGVRVVPLTGPSSIILALMGSGLNGQNFAFVGYLPIKPDERVKKIRQLEARSREELQTQLFIETPYRNNKLLEALLTTLHPETLLHISADLTIASEAVETKRVKDWKNKMPDLHKRPSIFGIQA